MSDESDSEKTEDPTPERRRKAREEGKIARSSDAGPVAATLAVLITLLALSGTIQRHVGELFVRHLRVANQGFDVRVITHDVGIVLVVTCLPLALAASVGGIAIGLAQAGFEPRAELVEPKWDRLDPISRLGQMFSPSQGLLSTLMALGKVSAVAGVAWMVLGDAVPDLLRLARAPLSAGLQHTGDLLRQLVLVSTFALAVLAALEYGKSWWQLEKSLKMSLQEVKDEFKQQEGDPKVRGRMRARAREMAKRGLAKEVKRADVIIANPTHVSVALRYRPEEGAPVLLAKGYDEVALYIRELAAENQIPIVENIPLARGLAANVKVGRAISAEFYAAVAQVLAFVYRLKGRRLKA